MTHEDAVLLIADGAVGRLPEERRAGLEEHLRGCEECRGLRDAYLLFAALREPAGDAGGGHPSSGALVAWVIGDAAPASAETGRLAAHVAACATCGAEAEATRRAFAPPGPVLAAPRLARARFTAAIAAGVAAALLYPAYLGLSRLPRLNAEVEALRASRDGMAAEIAGTRQLVEEMQSRLATATAWTGVVRVQVLAGPRRGGPAAARAIVVPPDAPYVVLAVEPPDPGPGSGAFRFTITAADGSVAWSTDLDGQQLRRLLRESGRATLVVPAPDLPPDSGTLTLARAERPDRLLLRIPITISREP